MYIGFKNDFDTYCTRNGIQDISGLLMEYIEAGCPPQFALWASTKRNVKRYLATVSFLVAADSIVEANEEISRLFTGYVHDREHLTIEVVLPRDFCDQQIDTTTLRDMKPDERLKIPTV